MYNRQHFLEDSGLEMQGQSAGDCQSQRLQKTFFFYLRETVWLGKFIFGNRHHNKPQTTEWKMFELKLLSNLKIGILRGRRLKELEGGFINIGRRNQSESQNILGR